MQASDRSWSFLRRTGLVALISVVRGCKKETPVDGPTISEVSTQLHVAEYQALTTRITHWIILQYSLLGVIAAVLLDFLKQPARLVETGMRVWAVVIVVEIIIGAYYYTLFEIMSSRAYIETQLAKMVRIALPGTKEFWGHESYMRGNRVYSPAGMYLWMILCIGAPYAALLLFRPPQREAVDFGGAIVSMALSYWVFHIARSSVLAQKRYAP